MLIEKMLMDLSSFERVHKGGKDEVAYNLLRGFSELGYTENIVCTGRPELEEKIHSINPNYLFVPIYRAHFYGRIGNLFSPFPDLFYGLKLSKVIKEYNCKRILFTNKFSPFLKYPIKTYLLPHDIQAFRILEQTNKPKLYTRVFALLIRINFQFCDRIIAISEFDKNEITRFIPCCKEKIVQIYDPVRFRAIIPAKEKNSITALNIQHDSKNTLTLIKAYARIANRINERLVLVGRRNFRPKVEEEIKRIITDHQLEKRICFTGFVDEKELSEIIAKTRIFVNPSLFEGFGMAAVEMMACRIPTIVAKNSAQPETTMGLCHYYEPATDEKALSEAIMNELQNPTTDKKLMEAEKALRDRYDYINISKEYWKEIMLKEN